MINPEFSRPISTRKLGNHPASYDISAGPAELDALAARFGLVSLSRLAAEITLRRAGGGAIRVQGMLHANLIQSCIATLEPVPEQIDEPFSVLYRPDLDEAEADRLAIEQLEEEDLEPLVDETIDLGEAVAQQLAIMMEPFPRAEGVAWTEIEDEDIATEKPPKKTPFAALAALKKRSQE